MPGKKLYHFTHSSPEIKTLADLLAKQDSPVFLYNQDPNGFLKIIGEDGQTNRQRIESTYTLPEDAIYKGADFSRMPLHTGTVLYLEFEKVNKPSFLTEGINVVSNDDPAFKARKLAELEADTGYVQIDKPVHGKLAKGSLKTSYPDVTVWIWCSALSPKADEDNQLTGQFFNLTPFIQSLTTNSSKNGGNFQIKLPPLACELDKEKNVWILKKGTIDQYLTNKGTSLQGDGYVAQTTLFQPEPLGDDVLIRTPMLFHNIISPNDLVYIRFETLLMERDQRYEDANEYAISKKHLANRIYDMIGLVDSNTQSVTASNNDVSISITGRDLSKLFIEDGTYFYALENSQGILKFAGQSSTKNSLTNRIFADNGMSYIGLYMFNSIEYILKFIIQQLSNIGIVPDELFTSYAKSVRSLPGFRIEEYDARNKTFTDFDTNGADLKKKGELRHQGIAIIEELRSKAGNKIFIPDVEANTQREIFWFMVHFLETLRTNNNRQVNEFNKTQGWKGFNYRGEALADNTFPKYVGDELLNDKGEMDDNLYRLVNTCDNYIDAGLQSKQFKEQLAKGIWQIVDLVIDKSVGQRRLVDSSFSTANGSLLNFIRSACQEPFVEFFMDTYGDKYSLIVRRPPYDQKGLISLIEGQVNSEDGQIKVPPAIVDVYPDDVILESLAYDDSQIYSWYHVFPKTSVIGDSSDYSLSYLGALYFPEYAEIYGSKPFQQVNSYVPYKALKNSNAEGLGIDEQQAVEDLKYVVESSQYLPFTRKGVLTLNRDRRLKIGNVMRYKSTGEIFFITGVQHSYSINETNVEAITTVHVERGMIEQLIYGAYLANDQGKPRFVSYFNIINTKLAFDRKEVTVQETRKVKKKSATPQLISKDVVTPGNFIINNFLQGSQIIEHGENIGLGYLETYNQYPKSKNLFINFINLINQKGYWVSIGARSANRTYAQQAALKRENSNNADPGHSKHERGSAIDITLIDKSTGRIHSKTTDKDAWIATGIPAIAESLALQWGGGDGSFGKYVDRVHFEIKQKTELLSYAQQEADQFEDVTKTVKKMVIDKNGIFQNFKVNQFSLNFFRKRLQHSGEFRDVSSRKIYDNGGQLLDDVIVRSTKKKKV
ncbi:MAG: hypothetical protein QM737_01415 [Ferruginibacter sp.]